MFFNIKKILTICYEKKDIHLYMLKVLQEYNCNTFLFISFHLYPIFAQKGRLPPPSSRLHSNRKIYLNVMFVSWKRFPPLPLCSGIDRVFITRVYTEGTIFMKPSVGPYNCMIFKDNQVTFFRTESWPRRGRVEILCLSGKK